jgi:hypothetical protein
MLSIGFLRERLDEVPAFEKYRGSTSIGLFIYLCQKSPDVILSLIQTVLTVFIFPCQIFHFIGLIKVTAESRIRRI